MTRRPDWEARLHAYLESVAGKPFAWGSHDCCLFAAGAVKAITGDDPMPEFRGRYTTAAGSVRALKRYGAGTLEETIDGKFPERPVAFARRGDLAFVNGMVGVVVGGDALFVGEEDGTEGLVRFPRAAWAKCWGVG